MSNMYGRQVVLPLVNKSGGGVIAGDVVIIDTSNDGSFTTTTSGGYGGSVGIAQETIANNATGRVLTSGYAALVNVPSSQTRGHFIKTHTVVKQATGASARAAGMFGQLLTGGTTPTAWLWGMTDNAGASGETVATSAIWDAAGDLAVGTGADAAARLAIGATNGMAVQRVSGSVAWALPPGYEFDYAQITSPVTVSGVSEAAATTIITGNAVTYDGSTVVMVEFYAPSAFTGAAANNDVYVYLYDGSGSIGLISTMRAETANRGLHALQGRRRLTPSNASHTYSIRAAFTGNAGNIDAGAGGSGNSVPAFIRITKV